MRLQEHGDGELAIIQKLQASSLPRTYTSNSDACTREELLLQALDLGSQGINSRSSHKHPHSLQFTVKRTTTQPLLELLDPPGLRSPTLRSSVVHLGNRDYLYAHLYLTIFHTNLSCAANMAHCHTEVIDGRCLGAPRCSCFECSEDNAFGCSRTTDGPLLRAKSPRIVLLRDVHRCKRFPCPFCNPSPRRRSQRRQVEDSPGARHDRDHEAPTIILGDGRMCLS